MHCLWNTLLYGQQQRWGKLKELGRFRKVCSCFGVSLTVHHSINLFFSPTWCTIHLFCNICITLNTSTCFEQYYTHLQKVKTVFLQHLECHFLWAAVQCTVWEALNRCTARPSDDTRCCKMQFRPPEDEHSNVRNMSRYLM
jgi:hypothetical protein